MAEYTPHFETDHDAETLHFGPYTGPEEHHKGNPRVQKAVHDALKRHEITKKKRNGIKKAHIDTKGVATYTDHSHMASKKMPKSDLTSNRNGREVTNLDPKSSRYYRMVDQYAPKPLHHFLEQHKQMSKEIVEKADVNFPIHPVDVENDKFEEKMMEKLKQLSQLLDGLNPKYSIEWIDVTDANSQRKQMTFTEVWSKINTSTKIHKPFYKKNEVQALDEETDVASQNQAEGLNGGGPSSRSASVAGTEREIIVTDAIRIKCALRYLYEWAKNQKTMDDLYKRDMHLVQQHISTHKENLQTLKEANTITEQLKGMPFYTLLEVFYLQGLKMSRGSARVMENIFWHYPVALEYLNKSRRKEYQSGHLLLTECIKTVNVISRCFDYKEIGRFKQYALWCQAVHRIVHAHTDKLDVDKAAADYCHTIEDKHNELMVIIFSHGFKFIKGYEPIQKSPKVSVAVTEAEKQQLLHNRAASRPSAAHNLPNPMHVKGGTSNPYAPSI